MLESYDYKHNCHVIHQSSVRPLYVSELWILLEMRVETWVWMEGLRPGNYEIMFITHLGTLLSTHAALNHVMKYKNISQLVQSGF